MVVAVFVTERVQRLGDFPAVTGVAMGLALFVVGHVPERMVDVSSSRFRWVVRAGVTGKGNRLGPVGGAEFLE